MLSKEGKEEVSAIIGRINVVWTIMLGAVGIYVVVTLLFVTPDLNPLNVDRGLFPLFSMALALISAAEILVMVWLGRRFNSKKSIDRFLAGRGATAINIEIPDSNLLDDDKLALALIAHYFQAVVIRWSLIEVVAVYGLALSIFTGQSLIPSLFYLGAAVGLVTSKANIKDVEALVATARGR